MHNPRKVCEVLQYLYDDGQSDEQLTALHDKQLVTPVQGFYLTAFFIFTEMAHLERQLNKNYM